MKYTNIPLKKYQIINHVINTYAESHSKVKPNISYDPNTCVLDITGISKPISFHTDSIGIIPKGAYEVVGQVIRSKTSDGRIDTDGMNIYDSPQRIFNIANTNRERVFEFIDKNSKSSYCSCCGTNRERSRLFYIREVDSSDKIYQVGSRCIKEYFDTSYFDLMKDISNIIELEGRATEYKFSDYNLIDYLTLYSMFMSTSKNIKSCSKKISDILDSYDNMNDTQWKAEFEQQKNLIIDKIITLSKFYHEYPNYCRNDNILTIKTIQSMSEMLEGNINIDPFYSKSNCLIIAKMYTSLLSDYARDYRRYQSDLFKYNAYTVETELNDLWKTLNHTPYYLTFELDRLKCSLSYRICISHTRYSKNKVVVPLDSEGRILNESKIKDELVGLISKINDSYIDPSQKNTLLTALSAYKEEYLSRYKNFKPTILYKYEDSLIKFFDYTNDPLVINLNEDIEVAKSKLSAFINISYNRQRLNSAYIEFSKKYIGACQMAYTQSPEINSQFSCSYIESIVISNWPKGHILPKFISYIDNLGKNVIVQYKDCANYLKLPLNSIGTICGADYDIDVRIKTYIAEELNLPIQFSKKVRQPKTAEDILKTRPKKNVTRLFSSLGSSAKNLVSIRKVNILNDTSSPTIGVTAPKVGKILFTMNNGEVIHENDTYKGRISLDGHVVSDNKTFDKPTFISSVHALEYLVYLSDDSNNPMYMHEVSTTKSGTNYTYKYPLKCGTCSGNLQFRIVEVNGKCTLKYGPKFVIEKSIGTDKFICTINLNFNETCWSTIQQGKLDLSNIQRSTGIINGQRNTNLISGCMWINGGEPQKISNEIFTKLTGIHI